MRVLTRYFFKELLKFYFLLQFVFLSLYVMIQLIQKMDDFIGAGASMGLLLVYVAYQIPLMVAQLSPVAVLISVIILFVQMKKAHEIVALKSAGMSILRLSKPVMAMSLVISAFMFLLSELVVPYTVAEANEIWDVQLRKGKGERFYGQNNIWYKGDRSIYWIRHFDPNTRVMEDLTLYLFDASFRLKERIDARKGSWTGQGWQMDQGLLLKLKSDGGYEAEPFNRIARELPEGPEAFVRTLRRPEEMGYWQLGRYAEKVRLEGYDATPYEVDMHIKMAFPLLNTVMVLVGVPIALGPKRRGASLSVSLGIGACFIYLLVFGLARSLGISNSLPALVSAWFANLIFFFVGVYLMIQVER